MANSVRFASLQLVLLGLFFAWVQPVVGQSTGGHEDIIYLVNKGRYRGEIIDWDREGQVRIRTWNGLEVDVPKEMIRRIVQKRVPGVDPRFSHGRFYKAVTLGFGTIDAEGSFLFDAQFGYQFNRWALVGLSTGAHILDVNSQLQSVPLMLEWRAFPFQRRLSPYVGLRGGLCFPWEEEDPWAQDQDYLTSYAGNAIAGLQLGQIGEAAFLMETGYQFNRIHSEQRYIGRASGRERV